jgi:hypothetical protein
VVRWFGGSVVRWRPSCLSARVAESFVMLGVPGFLVCGVLGAAEAPSVRCAWLAHG